MNAKERMDSGNDPCPQCGFRFITVEELIIMLEKIKDKKFPVFVATEDGLAQPFSHLNDRPDKHCVYLVPTKK